MRNRYVRAGVVGGFVFAAIAAVGSEALPKRLIESGKVAKKAQWLTPAQIDEILHREHQAGRCGGFMDVTEHYRTRPENLQVKPTFQSQVPDPSQQKIVEPLLNQVSTPAMVATIEHLSNFLTRHARSETGVRAVHWLQSHYMAIAQGRTDITSELIQHSFAQPSLIVRIQGSGPRAHERVILGGHVDSIQGSIWGGNMGRAPGADDDASGIATLVEVFRILVQSGYKPDRTLEFIAYAGEELGLLGSQDIAERYRRGKIPVSGVLQFDMTLYPSKGRTIAFITDHTDSSLTEFTRKLNDTYVKVPWKNIRCGYACSDHASWTKSGFPTVFPFEGETTNPSIHTERDTLSLLDMELGTYFVKLGLAYAVEMSAAVSAGR